MSGKLRPIGWPAGCKVSPLLLAKISLSLGLLGLLSACGGSRDPLLAHKRQRFTEQLRSVCQDERVVYRKTVTDLTLDSAPRQDSSWQAQKGVMDTGEDSTRCVLERDLAYALAYSYEQPALRDYFQVDQQGDTLIAQLRPDAAGKLELQSQKVIPLADGEGYRYLATQLKKDTWLYKMQVQIEVFFDEKGRYDHHQLEMESEVLGGGEVFKARIEGQASYP